MAVVINCYQPLAVLMSPIVYLRSYSVLQQLLCSLISWKSNITKALRKSWLRLTQPRQKSLGLNNLKVLLSNCQREANKVTFPDCLGQIVRLHAQISNQIKNIKVIYKDLEDLQAETVAQGGAPPLRSMKYHKWVMVPTN